MIDGVLTWGELEEIEREVQAIDAELDWRCPNREGARIDELNARLDELIEILEGSCAKARRRESRLRVVRGGR